MRTLLGVCVVAACGTAAPQAKVTANVAAVEAPARVLTPREMLRAFPANTRMLFVLDVKKLRKSPLLARLWTTVGEVPEVQEALGTLCGLHTQIDYMLLAMSDDGAKNIWAWMQGVDSHATLDCPTAKDDAKDRQRKTSARGNYVVETSTASITEELWSGPKTAFIYYQAGGTTPAGEPAMQRALDQGGGFGREGALARLLDHVDFDAGAVFLIDGSFAKQPGVGGAALSIEADDGMRMQAYVELDNEDRALALQSDYRTALTALEAKHMIDSGEARAQGRGMAASIAVTGAQFEWWIQFAIAKLDDPNATPPPPPP
jgi:hypothetical protein